MLLLFIGERQVLIASFHLFILFCTFLDWEMLVKHRQLCEDSGRDIFDLSLVRVVAQKVAESGWLLKSNL